MVMLSLVLALMNRAVGLNNQLGFYTTQIHDVVANLVLAAELEIHKSAGAQKLPQDRFGWRLVPSQLTGTLDQS